MSECGGTEVKADPNTYTNVESYGFSVDVGGIINALIKISTPVRWSRKSDQPDARKDQTKWFQFHHDHGHINEYYIALRREVAFMLNKGQLEDLLSDKGKASFHKNPLKSNPPASRVHVKLINVICGGSDICRLTYPTTKRLEREGSPLSKVPKDFRSDDESKLEAMFITSEDDDVCTDEHHDRLIISLTVVNCLMRRVSIDGGRSIDMLFKSA